MRGTVLSTLAAAILFASAHADAGGGHRNQRHSHSHARVGVYIGAPIVFAPWWSSRPYYAYPPYYYPPAPVIVREQIVVREPLIYYDERGNPVPPVRAQAQAQPPTQAQPSAESSTPTWFFCADSQSYYPYVQNCASPWQRVMPLPPPQ